MTMRKTIDIPQIQKRLEEQKEILVQRLKAFREESNRSDNPNRADLAMRVIQSERQGLLFARAEEQLKEVRGALDRIVKNTYGLCEVCGQPIPPERLDAIPTTRVCMNCKRGT